MKLKFCSSCKEYNLTSLCSKCKKETKEAHYKYINLKDEKEIHPDS